MGRIIILALVLSLKLHAIVVYDFPEVFPASDRYLVRVDGHPISPLQTERGAILNFGMSGPVRVEVQLGQAPENVVIRPLNAGIKAEIKGRVFRFELPTHMNLSVEVDGDLKNPLLVFANPEELNPPAKSDPKVQYFEAGEIHQVDEIFLDDGETLYMEPGAVVNAVVRAVKVLDPPGVAGVPFEEMIDPETLGKHAVPRIADDVIGDILVTNCVVWNDAAQGLEIGFELRVDRVKGVTFRNCDVIHSRGGAAFSIHNGDRAMIEDVALEDIRLENVRRVFDFHAGLSIYSHDCPQPFRRSNPNRKAPSRRPEVATNPWQWFAPADEDLHESEDNRGMVRNVVAREISVLEEPELPSILQGYSPRKMISDVTFVGLVVAGRPVLSADDIKLYQKHTKDVGVFFRKVGARPGLIRS